MTNAEQFAAAVPPWAEERDPHGLDPHVPGAKVDAGKAQPELIMRGFSRALSAVTDVGTYGAQKYTRDGWEQVEDGVRRYRNAMYRHRSQYYRGETLDPDTRIHHLAHAAWNTLAELELLLRKSDEG